MSDGSRTSPTQQDNPGGPTDHTATQNVQQAGLTTAQIAARATIMQTVRNLVAPDNYLQRPVAWPSHFDFHAHNGFDHLRPGCAYMAIFSAKTTLQPFLFVGNQSVNGDDQYFGLGIHNENPGLMVFSFTDDNSNTSERTFSPATWADLPADGNPAIIASPVAALARRVHHIRTHTTDDNALLGSYYPRPLHGRRHITYDDINKHLKHTAKAMNLQQYNIPPERISSHSLRAGGALALYLNGTPAMSIRLMGRWSSDTFLRYIHPQFSHFSQGFAQRMSKAIQLHNVSINPSIHNP